MGIWNKIDGEWQYHTFESMEAGGIPIAKVRKAHNNWMVFLKSDNFEKCQKWAKTLKQAQTFTENILKK